MATSENDVSAQPGKQRKRQANAPQHERREMMSAHLSEDLMLEYERRSITVRTGDEIEIMRGDFAGHRGEVLEIDYKNQELEIDGVVNRSSDGSQVARPIHPSNVRLVELDLSDPRRRQALERKGVTVEEPEPEPEPEPEVEPEAEEEPEAQAEAEPEPVQPAPGAKGPDVAPEDAQPDIEAEGEPEEQTEAEDEQEAEAEDEAQPEAEEEAQQPGDAEEGPQTEAEDERETEATSASESQAEDEDTQTDEQPSDEDAETDATEEDTQEDRS